MASKAGAGEGLVCFLLNKAGPWSVCTASLGRGRRPLPNAFWNHDPEEYVPPRHGRKQTLPDFAHGVFHSDIGPPSANAAAVPPLMGGNSLGPVNDMSATDRLGEKRRYHLAREQTRGGAANGVIAIGRQRVQQQRRPVREDTCWTPPAGS